MFFCVFCLEFYFLSGFPTTRGYYQQCSKLLSRHRWKQTGSWILLVCLFLEFLSVLWFRQRIWTAWILSLLMICFPWGCSTPPYPAMLLCKDRNTFGECFSILRNVAVLTAGTHELKEILEESNELVLSFAIGKEEGEENWEVTGSDHYIFGELFCDVGGMLGTIGEVLDWCYTAEWHQLYY